MRKGALAGLLAVELGSFAEAAAPESSSAVRITVGPNVQVSKARDQMIHNEVLLAAHPADPNNLLGCSIIEPQALNARVPYEGVYAQQPTTVAYLSFDGGASWTPTLEAKEGLMSGDPACALGSDGSAYFASLPFYGSDGSEEEKPADIVPRFSKDGGKTWTISEIPWIHGVDREYLAVDSTGGKFHGRVYLVAQSSGRALDGEKLGWGITLWRSRDGGAHFENPVILYGAKPKYAFHPGNGVILSDGTFVAAFSELGDPSEFKHDERTGLAPNGTVKVAYSTNGGDSLSKAVKVSDLYYNHGAFATAIPSLAVDRMGPFKDRLYLTWIDFRSGRAEILLSSSSDKGKTWSSPRAVNDDRAWARREGKIPGPNAVMPAVAVNRDGVVGVSWYDRRDNPDGVGYWVRFSASVDGGETFTPSIRVSESPYRFGDKEKLTLTGTSIDSKYGNADGAITLAVSRNEWIHGGHTAGLAADAGGRFHAFWVDNRTGIHQIWTAPVIVHAKAARHGSPELEDLEDLSTKVALEPKASSYDESKNLVSMTVSVRNISETRIRAPLKVRAIALTPGFKFVAGISETVQAVNADNHQTGPGAVWDFSDLIPAAGLEPNEVSRERVLLFRLSKVRAFHEGVGEEPTQFRFGLVNLKVRVLGRAEAKEKK